MLEKETAALGIFSTADNLERVLSRLKNAGYRNTELSVLFPHREEFKALAMEACCQAPADPIVGVCSGALFGGALGWLAGIGMLSVPGIGPFIAAGPIVAALAGAAAGGMAGGLGGVLVGMGLPENEAYRFAGRVKDGGILLSVHSDSISWTQKAEGILKESGAEDLVTTMEPNVLASCK